MIRDPFRPGLDSSDESGDLYLPERPAWHALAACRGMADSETNVFFPGPGQRNFPEVQAAREICQTCDVVAPCLEAGLDQGYGIWGGTTERQRRLIRRQRRNAA